MSQNISVKLIDQDYKTIKSFDLDLSNFIHELRQVDSKDYPLLYSIDEYDNTWFNKNQCEIASNELKSMLKDDSLSKLENNIKELLDILSGVERYDYILFSGD